MSDVGGGALLQAVKYQIVHHTRGSGLDIGRGPRKAFPHFVAVRERSDKTMPPHVAADLWVDSFDKLGDSVKPDSLDFVFVWGLPLPLTMLDAINVALKVGGYLIVVTEEHPAPDKCQYRGKGLYDQIEVFSNGRKTACVVRYGAIGDQLQAASILPELKRQGYHVTWMCEPSGEHVMRHDPHIDAFLVQDKDQVPNNELHPFWEVQRKKFDKWINLCESVEGTLITLPGRMSFTFPHDARHQICNKNYLEFTATLAELPFHPEHRFYPSEVEVAAALGEIVRLQALVNKDWVIGQKWQRPYIVMIALSGSSVHKFYPHMDAVIAKILLEIPHAHIVMVGDDACRILEAGWENEPRVHCKSGEMALRDTLALAQRVDLVIGPETGVMNAVAFENMAKVVLLSHSSHENLTKHWNNTEALHTSVTPCYPCHQLHQNHDHCPEHPETGAAMCQWELPAADVWAAVQRAYTATGTVRKLLEAA